MDLESDYNTGREKKKQVNTRKQKKNDKKMNSV